MNTLQRQRTAALKQVLYALKLPKDTDTIEKLLAYLDILNQWNRAYNLTAICDPLAQITKHIADSLSVLPYMQGKLGLDIGTGPGFPGIPLAICLPDMHWTLLDKSAKKVHFLIQVQATLGLTNVRVLQKRVAEYMPQTPLDCVISRAFAPLPQMIEETKHLYARPHAIGTPYLWAMKGRYPQQELACLAKAYTVYPICVPQLQHSRHLVRIDMKTHGETESGMF